MIEKEGLIENCATLLTEKWQISFRFHQIWWEESVQWSEMILVELFQRTFTFRQRPFSQRKLPRCNEDFIQYFTIYIIHYLIVHLIIFSTKDKTSFWRFKNDPANILQTFPINYIMGFELISRFNLILLFLFAIKSNFITSSVARRLHETHEAPRSTCSSI